MKVKQLSSAVALMAMGVAAQASELQYDFSVGASKLYDTNVSVENLDVNSSEGDSATEIFAKGSVKKSFDNGFTATAKYKIKDKIYSKFSEFDLLTQIASVEGSYKFENGSKAGLALYKIKGDLDNKDYLDMTRISPSYSMFAGKDYYVRGEVATIKKEFHENKDRNSDSLSASFSTYRFIEGAKNFVSATVTYKTEDADSEIYDNKSTELKVSWNKKVKLADIDLGLKVGGKYENRSYDSDKSAVTEARSDKKFGLNFSVDHKISEKTTVDFKYDFMDTSSNLKSQDVDQHVMKVGINFKF